jgi:hypothetical protein
MSAERPNVNAYVSWFYAALLAALAGTWPLVVKAQPSEEGDGGPVRVGDRWVYDTKDEITGFPKDTYSEIVTEVSSGEIVTNWTFTGKPGSLLVIYDHNWDRLDNAVWKFKPNDGQGVRLPLAVGKKWRVEFYATNSQTGVNMKSSISSKVIAQETVTTSAGTFDTFKIERTEKQFKTSDPSKLYESQMVVWYAPKLNHWVRRTYSMKYAKHLRISTSEELADFSREFEH